MDIDINNKDTFITCPYCKVRFRHLGSHLKITHNKSKTEFLKEYPEHSLACKQIVEKASQSQRVKYSLLAKKYDLNPNKCLYCDKIFSFKEKHKKFCNQSHAAFYNNKNKTITNKLKISIELKNLQKQSNVYIRKKNMKYRKILGLPKLYYSSVEYREKQSYKRINHLNGETSGKGNLLCPYYKVWNGNREVTVQGSWEKRFGEWLTNNKLKWEKSFEFSLKYDKTHNYMPDFYLIDLNIYIEVKGFFKDSDKIKYKKVYKEHSDKKILFLNSLKQINQLEKNELSLFELKELKECLD